MPDPMSEDRPIAPDWRAIVAACGASPRIVSVNEWRGATLRVPEAMACEITPAGDRWIWWHGLTPHSPPMDAESAVRAALAYLRGELDRRITELQAARERLGDTNA